MWLKSKPNGLNPIYVEHKKEDSENSSDQLPLWTYALNYGTRP